MTLVTCGDSLIRDRIIMGIRYEGYENSQADLLKVGKLTLKEFINICRSAKRNKMAYETDVFNCERGYTQSLCALKI